MLAACTATNNALDIIASDNFITKKRERKEGKRKKGWKEKKE